MGKAIEKEKELKVQRENLGLSPDRQVSEKSGNIRRTLPNATAAGPTVLPRGSGG